MPPASISLASLRQVGTTLIPAVPTLYTTQITIAPPITACAGIIQNVGASKAAFLSNYMSVQMMPTQQTDIINNLQTFHTQLTNSAVDKLQTIDETKYTNLDSYLTSLSTSIPVIQLATNCLTEAAGTPLVTLATDYNNQKELLDESKERLEFIKAPEEHVSYYAGWFPLFRPMKPTVIFCLFGISLALLILSILLFLRVGGVEILITLPVTSMSMPTPSSSYINYAIGGVGAGAIIAYLGFKRGWFGT